MRCPACKTHEHSEIHLRSDQFNEDLFKCPTCGTTWSVNHGVMEVVTDTQEHSFLAAKSECVEGDDYNHPPNK